MVNMLSVFPFSTNDLQQRTRLPLQEHKKIIFIVSVSFPKLSIRNSFMTRCGQAGKGFIVQEQRCVWEAVTVVRICFCLHFETVSSPAGQWAGKAQDGLWLWPCDDGWHQGPCGDQTVWSRMVSRLVKKEGGSHVHSFLPLKSLDEE